MTTKNQKILLIVVLVISVLITALSFSVLHNQTEALHQQAAQAKKLTLASLDTSSMPGDIPGVEDLIKMDPNIISDEDMKEHWKDIIKILYNPQFESYVSVFDFKPSDDVAYIFSNEEAAYYSERFGVQIIPGIEYINTKYYELVLQQNPDYFKEVKNANY